MEGGRDGKTSAFVPAHPWGRARHLGWGIPLVALPGTPRAIPMARGILTTARPLPGPLTDSADTQATKPKVSRIHARRIFLGDRFLPAAACRARTKPPPAQRSARAVGPGAEQPPRSGLGLGGARSLLRLLPPPAQRPGNAAPSHLLVSALRARSWRSGEAALWTSSASAGVVLLTQQTPSPRRGLISDFRE